MHINEKIGMDLNVHNSARPLDGIQKLEERLRPCNLIPRKSEYK